MPPITRDEFESAFKETIVPEIIAEVKTTGLADNAVKWLENNLLINTLGGKYNRGMTIPDTARIILGKEVLDKEEYDLARILGWCVELLQSMFLVADDIMDSSITRRGQQCWYRQPNVGMVAINDSFLLESSIYLLLKKHFRTKDYYVDLVDLFHEVTLQTELGQLLDLITAPEDKVDLSNFDFQKYYFIVRYKTAYYSFYLPVALSMYMTGIATPGNLRRAKDVLIPLGEYFQVQDDFLDCYGDAKYIGKVGTDIKDNKCGWLVNKALELATPAQRKILDENYGQKDDAKEKRIKDLYVELNVEKHYREYEEESIKKIESLIAGVDESQGLKRDVLTGFLNRIARRDR